MYFFSLSLVCPLSARFLYFERDIFLCRFNLHSIILIYDILLSSTYLATFCLNNIKLVVCAIPILDSQKRLWLQNCGYIGLCLTLYGVFGRPPRPYARDSRYYRKCVIRILTIHKSVLKYNCVSLWEYFKTGSNHNLAVSYVFPFRYLNK